MDSAFGALWVGLALLGCVGFQLMWGNHFKSQFKIIVDLKLLAYQIFIIITDLLDKQGII